MKLIRSILVLVLCAGFARPVSAQEELASRLQELNEKIELSKKDLAEVSSRHASLEAETKNSAVQILKLQTQEGQVETDLRERTEQRAALDRKIAESESKTAQLKTLYQKRIRTLYMFGNREILPDMVRPDSEPMFVRSAYYLSKVRAFDSSLLKNIAETQRATEAQRLELSEVVRVQQELRESLAAQREQLAKRLSQQQSLAAELKKERLKRETILAGLNAQALRLETVLASLTNGGESPQAKPSKKGKRQPAQSKGFSSFEGPGLIGLKGRLRLPAPGKIVQSFGKRTEQGAPARKGVDIATSDVSDVSAVAAGRVLFVGRMPEFNTVLIIDHGARYYSLYGRLSQVSTSVGDEVEAGEILGKSSDPKVVSPNLYFEIRSAGIAVDPEAFLGKS